MNRKTAKMCAIASLILAAVLALSGCGGQSGSSGDPSPSAAGNTAGTPTPVPQTPTPAPTPTPEPTPTALVISDPPEGYDAGDKVPEADILDLVFENGEAKDASTAANDITALNDPTVKKDSLIDKDAAEFEGGEAGEDVMYAMYGFGEKYADTLADGFTFEVYARVIDDETYGVMLGYMQAGGAGIDFDPTNSSNEWNTGANASIGFGVRDDADNSYVFLYREDAIDTDRYYHVVGTFDGKNVCLYYDGLLIKSAESKGSLCKPNLSSPYLGIGGDMGEDTNGEDALGGRIAVARVYSVPLTASQVYNRYLQVVKG